ncbi:porphobilinogen synthase [Candidatus Aminicenantes bacterium AC-708-M15]|jgi:porphobilinogen synthase|nr:porphobilinogen synthase [SCandidatus Aminicenantes bacterium Aminicenantia_JdfR_composite]MCP2604033.1 porphobilinogen synthase [Candidatus Aminicenantes bacterium AC-708-M15]MCP2618336.1 porphobilinogen synthase [Candidatus Aminicenantes bacterium AC-335-A11]
MGFPINRMRRLRKNENLRRMVRETKISVDDLIYPLFVRPGKNIKVEISSMPGNYQWSVDLLVKECEEIFKLGIPAVILFGIPESKDELGSEAYSENGIVQRALRAIKKEVPDLILIADVCLCEYTSHGHCGVVENGYVNNDKTLELLAKSALSFAEAGADIVAPSDMMDGRVKAIREILDRNGFFNIPIMAYSAKYASSFYGPFREAAESAPKFGDRKSYQMDPPNAREALREIELDIEEGADIIMVKPALSYLDIISKARERFNVPIAAYNVSGEFSMVKAASRLGWIDEEKIMYEILISIKRAGADLILTYFAKDIAKKLKSKN